MPRIEVELRARFTEAKYTELSSFLTTHAEDIGEDDKDVYFFILPDKLVKVVDNVSKGTAKIVLKLTKIGRGSSFEEVEIPIARKDVGKAVKLLTAVGLTEVQQSFQKRHNYVYKGAELALKYSDAWGHHLELELMVDRVEAVPEAERALHAIADELGVHIMTDAELAEFTKRKDAEYRTMAS